MKTLKIASIVTGIVFAAGMGFASAEPMELTGAQMDDVTGGLFGGYYCFTCPGSVAQASADAQALGWTNASSANTATFSAPGVSAASSASGSCSNAGC